jgi:hypoxanthine phosphoribosyltransferase
MREIKIQFSIEEMHLALIKIINQINESNWTPDLILSVNRGGCVPGVYLSHMIQVPHKVVDVQLRDAQNHPNLEVLENGIKSYSNILIIDDINDTGATFNFIKKNTTVSDNKIKYACLIDNRSSDFIVDFSGKQIDKSKNPCWIVFPWERNFIPSE